MNRFFIQNRLPDYIDNELSNEERAAFEAAIQQHPDLQQDLQDRLQQRQLLVKHGMLTAPEHMEAQILDRIKELPKPSANNNRWFLPSVAAAGILAVLLLPDSPAPQGNTGIDNAQLIPTPNRIILPEQSSIPELAAAKEEAEPKSAVVAPPTKPPSPAKKKDRPPSATFVIDPPDSPYVADWEGEVITLRTTEQMDIDAYLIRLAEDDILFRLEELSQRYNGSMLTMSGTRLNAFALNSENGFQRLKILVPVEQANPVDQQLRQLGATFRQNSVNAEGGYAVFPVEITHKFY